MILRSANESLVKVLPVPDSTFWANSFFFAWSVEIFSSTVPSHSNLKTHNFNLKRLFCYNKRCNHWLLATLTCGWWRLWFVQPGRFCRMPGPPRLGSFKTTDPTIGEEPTSDTMCTLWLIGNKWSSYQCMSMRNRWFPPMRLRPTPPAQRETSITFEKKQKPKQTKWFYLLSKTMWWDIF